jgi:hypothetical protein
LLKVYTGSLNEFKNWHYLDTEYWYRYRYQIYRYDFALKYKLVRYKNNFEMRNGTVPVLVSRGLSQTQAGLRKIEEKFSCKQVKGFMSSGTL